MWWLLSACLFIPESEDAVRLAALVGDVRVAKVSPPYGTTAGGTTVTITGGPFDAVTAVRFGDAEATVDTVAGDTLVVRSPAVPDPGLVDLSVVTPAGPVTVEDAFTYWDDGTGLAGITGEFRHSLAVGDYWADPEEGDYATSTLSFVRPMEYAYWQNWAPQLDTCVSYYADGSSDYEFDPTIERYDAGAGTATETSGSTTVELEWSNGEERFIHYDMDTALYLPGETYDLALHGTTNIPELQIEGILRTPEGFVITEPPVEGAQPPRVDEDFDFEWEGGAVADAVFIQAGLLDAEVTGFQQQVFCAVRDVGAFTMPDGVWKDWQPNRQLDVIVGKYVETQALNPLDGSYTALAAVHERYGSTLTR